MRRTSIVAVAVAALLGAGAGAAVTAVDGSGSPHPMASSGRHPGAGSDWGTGMGWGSGMGSGTGWGSGIGWGSGMGSGMGWGSGMGAVMGDHVVVASEQEFLTEMVAHHEEAVRAARELARSDRATMRDFGERIVEVQSAQVAQMEDWLDEWYADASEDADYEPMMRDLSGLSGDRLDQAFLWDMVRHHMVAVMMAQHFLAAGLVEHDEVGALARDIRADQSAEIRQMRQWLVDWFG